MGELHGRDRSAQGAEPTGGLVGEMTGLDKNLSRIPGEKSLDLTDVVAL